MLPLNIDGLLVAFPHPHVYPEQLRYMFYLKKTLELNGNCVLEMPTGAGKTAALLSVSLAFHLHKKRNNLPLGKVIYCTRTVPEVTQVMEELARCVSALEKLHQEENLFTSIALTSRKTLCIHPEASSGSSSVSVDSRCYALTAPHLRSSDIEDTQKCPFFTPFTSENNIPTVPCSTFSLSSLISYGKQHTICPYFLARSSLFSADVIVFSFLYLIDPKVSTVIEAHKLIENSTIVFDESHNLDDACLDAFSIDLSLSMINHAITGLTDLTAKLSAQKSRSITTISTEFHHALERHAVLLGCSVPQVILPENLRLKALPFNLKRGEFFLSSARRVLDFLRSRLSDLSRNPETSFGSRLQVKYELPSILIGEIESSAFVTKEDVQSFPRLFSTLISALEIVDVSVYTPLASVMTFCQLISTFDEGFLVVSEPSKLTAGFIPTTAHKSETGRLRLTCLDPSFATKYLIGLKNSIILTSATLTPRDQLPKLLQIPVIFSESFTLSLPRKSAFPVVVTRADDQSNLSTRFAVRSNGSVIKNYAVLISNLCKVVPDGVVVFFPSHFYMNECLALWQRMDLIDLFTKYKLLLVDTPSEYSTTLAKHIAACNSGRGSLLFAVARGKISEGIDMSGHLARAVVIIGMPFRDISDPCLKARVRYFAVKFGIDENQWLISDAMRAASQCVGRSLRSKTDYSLMVFADKRYQRSDRISMLPPWIRMLLSEDNKNLSSDLAVLLAKSFFRDVSRKLTSDDLKGTFLSHDGAENLLSDLSNSFKNQLVSINQMM
ncbi:hypothetical protein RCL1_007823 [Eukaryota sp. TZLM3-RCL]